MQIQEPIRAKIPLAGLAIAAKDTAIRSAMKQPANSPKNDPATASPDLHSARMRQLAAFTATSFETEFPSPFGSAFYCASTGERIAQAYDSVMHQCDPTNHAEVNAIRAATNRLQRLSLRGHILYSTCEPCPMCMSACIWAELDLVVFGASTMEDAHAYWPQPSDVSPEELAARVRFDAKPRLLKHVERALCQDLFQRCDALRQQQNLQLPPNRQ